MRMPRSGGGAFQEAFGASTRALKPGTHIGVPGTAGRQRGRRAGEARTAAKWRADINGRQRVQTALCFLGHYTLTWAFYSERGPTGGFDRRCPDQTEVLAFH